MRPLPLDVARSYLLRGWMPLPVPFRSKNPGFEGWQHFTVTEADLPLYFSGTQINIGVRLGKVSSDLADVDLDCTEARALAPHFLPDTDAVFGRQTSPRSHWLYVAPIPRKVTFIDPVNGKRILELLTNGQQAIFPGSTHQDTGELIRWYEDGEPAPVPAPSLLRAVKRLAAAALLARYWPQEGSRQDAALALGGVLLRAGWTADTARNLIEAVCHAAGDEETPTRVKTVAYTLQKLEAEAPTTGWPTLTNILDGRVVKRACEWLDIQAEKARQSQNTDKADGRGERLDDSIRR
jgi:hypothetical protein